MTGLDGGGVLLLDTVLLELADMVRRGPDEVVAGVYMLEVGRLMEDMACEYNAAPADIECTALEAYGAKPRFDCESCEELEDAARV